LLNCTLRYSINGQGPRSGISKPQLYTFTAEECKVAIQFPDVSNMGYTVSCATSMRVLSCTVRKHWQKCNRQNSQGRERHFTEYRDTISQKARVALKRETLGRIPHLLVGQHHEIARVKAYPRLHLLEFASE
jgi:hypothetical protein